MDTLDRKLLNALQSAFPLVAEPYAALATRLKTTEEEVLRRVAALKEEGILRQVSAIFDSRSLGYDSTLVAMKITAEKLHAVAEQVNAHPGVSHNYGRNHAFNLWFTLTLPKADSIEATVGAMERYDGVQRAIILPALVLFKVGVNFDMTGESDPTERSATTGPVLRAEVPLTDRDVAFVRELQEDLPVTPRPFLPMAERLGVTEDEVLAWAAEATDRRIMRRYAAVIRHRSAGFGANAMGVWDVSDERIEELGPIMASFRGVTHCYQRPRYPPDWPYSIFTMTHGTSPQACLDLLASISEATGVKEYSLLWSTQEFKKIRVKYFV